MFIFQNVVFSIQSHMKSQDYCRFLLTFQSLFCGWRGTRGRSLLPGRMCSGGVQSICSSSLPFFFLLPLSAVK